MRTVLALRSAAKTTELSTRYSHKTCDAYILDADQNRIGCTETIKALGVYFSRDLNMEAEIKHIVRAMRARYWTLRNLK